MIYNVRLGFATNSSSTHSIIISKNKIYNNPPRDEYFGWDFFTLAKKSSKKEYLAGILYQHLWSIIGKDMAKDVVNVWCGLDKDDYKIGVVDHQSVPALPTNWDGKGINRQFFNDYKKFLLDESVVILGGNDNVSKKHLLSRQYETFILPLIYDRSNANLVARKDEVHGYWTLFDRAEGTKIRMSFSQDPIKPTKATFPELVDLKITDYCGMSCGFCYQDSTKEGEHGDISYIDSIIRMLGDNQVFEVALGGGDPTSHPNFTSILQTCQWAGVVPNFTISDLDWLDDEVKRIKWLDFCGGVAYSTTSSYGIRKLGFAIDKYKLPAEKFQVQIVEGLINDYQFSQILEECHYHNLTLTVLGYKHTGRGKDFANKRRLHDFDWISMAQKAWNEGRGTRIGIDTVLADKYQEKLISLGIDERLFTTREGSFSCYIDAVTQQIGPSSYAPDQMLSFTKPSQFIQKFSSF